MDHQPLRSAMKRARRIAVRFWEKVDPSGSCWLWTASTTGTGRWQYGTMVTGSRTDGSRRFRKAHHLAYELAIGPIPEGMDVHHLCGNTLCVRPSHLEIVSRRTHIVHRHDGIMAQNARKTHCPRGHPLSGDNLVIETKKDRERGIGRRCRICRRAFIAHRRSGKPFPWDQR